MIEVKKRVVVFEYGYLVCSHKAKPSPKITVVSIEAWEYIEQFCLQQADERKLFRLCTVGTIKAIQVRNYGGVIFIPDGTQIEILPKTAKKQSFDKARAGFLNMLAALPQFRHIQTQNANLATQKMPLLEVFIGQFLAQVNDVIKRGLRKDYLAKQENLSVLKGRLLIAEQLRVNSVNQHKFYVEYDEFQVNRPVNRVIRTALIKVQSYCFSAGNQKLLKELLFAFNDVPKSHNVKSDLAAIKFDRGMNYYQQALDWAKIVLEGLSPLTAAGVAQGASLLFPLEVLFECYVAKVLQSTLPFDTKLETQKSDQFLVSRAGDNLFRLKPDLYINQQGKGVVLDTKWKLIAPNKEKAKKTFGLSQSDFYQMFAYGHKYLDGKGELFLIYPKHDEFTEPVSTSFDFSHELKLWVVPFDVSAGVDDLERLLLPRSCTLNGAKRDLAV